MFTSFSCIATHFLESQLNAESFALDDTTQVLLILERVHKRLSGRKQQVNGLKVLLQTKRCSFEHNRAEKKRKWQAILVHFGNCMGSVLETRTILTKL